MLTTRELLEIQDSLQGKNSIQVIPILESPKTSKLKCPGIEINPFFTSKSKETKKADSCKGICFKHPNENGIWFKIRNATNISHLIKIFDNKTVWKQQCTFPCHAVAACYCKNVIVVSLIDNTLNFIDSRTGCPCLPSILLQGYTKYLQRVDEDKIALITNKNQLIIYEVDANTIPKCLLKVYFYGNLEDIRYVELTQELKTRQLSPIIQTESNRYRYSVARQCWTLPEFEYKSPFIKPEDNFESLDNVIKNFGYSLLTHNQTLMEKTYLTMLDETPYECTIRLIEYHNSGIKEISGILLSDVLEHAFNYIQDNYQDIVDRITESEQYKLYLSIINQKQAAQQEKDSNNTNENANNIGNDASMGQEIENNSNNISTIPTTGNLNNVNNISISSIVNTSANNTPKTASSITPNNSLINSIQINKSPTKQQFIVRELPVVESEKVNNRNSFDENLYAPMQDTRDFFYRFDSTYENYIELSQKKDPKIDKYIEAFSYSSNEQKEIAKKLKLKLPSKRKSKSTNDDKSCDDGHARHKHKKKRFIKPEIIQKKSSQQIRTPQQQPLILNPSFLQYSPQQFRQIQQLQQMQQISQMQKVQQMPQQIPQMPQAQQILQTQQMPQQIPQPKQVQQIPQMQQVQPKLQIQQVQQIPQVQQIQQRQQIPQVQQIQQMQQSQRMQQSQQIQKAQQISQMQQMPQIEQVQPIQPISNTVNPLAPPVSNPQPHPKQKRKSNETMNWLMYELQNPKQREIFSNVLTNSQWEQVMQFIESKHKAEQLSESTKQHQEPQQQQKEEESQNESQSQSQQSSNNQSQQQSKNSSQSQPQQHNSQQQSHDQTQPNKPPQPNKMQLAQTSLQKQILMNPQVQALLRQIQKVKMQIPQQIQNQTYQSQMQQPIQMQQQQPYKSQLPQQQAQNQPYQSQLPQQQQQNQPYQSQLPQQQQQNQPYQSQLPQQQQKQNQPYQSQLPQQQAQNQPYQSQLPPPQQQQNQPYQSQLPQQQVQNQPYQSQLPPPQQQQNQPYQSQLPQQQKQNQPYQSQKQQQFQTQQQMIQIQQQQPQSMQSIQMQQQQPTPIVQRQSQNKQQQQPIPIMQHQSQNQQPISIIQNQSPKQQQQPILDIQSQQSTEEISDSQTSQKSEKSQKNKRAGRKRASKPKEVQGESENKRGISQQTILAMLNINSPPSGGQPSPKNLKQARISLQPTDNVLEINVNLNSNEVNDQQTNKDDNSQKKK